MCTVTLPNPTELSGHTSPVLYTRVCIHSHKTTVTTQTHTLKHTHTHSQKHTLTVMLSWKHRHTATNNTKLPFQHTNTKTHRLIHMPTYTTTYSITNMWMKADSYRQTHTETHQHRHRDPHRHTTDMYTHPHQCTVASQTNLPGRKRNLDVLNIPLCQARCKNFKSSFNPHKATLRNGVIIPIFTDKPKEAQM